MRPKVATTMQGMDRDADKIEMTFAAHTQSQ